MHTSSPSYKGPDESSNFGSLNIAARAEITWVYLQNLGLACEKLLRSHYERIGVAVTDKLPPLNGDDWQKLSSTLIETNPELQSIASRAGIVNHKLLCGLVVDRVWAALSESIHLSLAGINPADIGAVFETIISRAKTGIHEPADQLHLDLFKINPIAGVVSAYVTPQILNSASNINQLMRGELPGDTRQSVVVRDWFNKTFEAALEWHTGLTKLFSMLEDRVADRPDAMGLVSIMEREFYRLWADSVQLFTIFAVETMRASLRPVGTQSSRFKTEHIYFPSFPRGSHINPLEIKQKMEPLLSRPAYLEFTDHFRPGFENARTVHVPVPMTPELCMNFMSTMTSYTLMIREALEAGGSDDPPLDLTFKHNLEVRFRPQRETDYQGNTVQPRVSFTAKRSDFYKFNIRLDFDTYGCQPGRGIVGLDFGAIDLMTAIDSSLWITDRLKNLPPYAERLVPGSDGVLKVKRNKTIEEEHLKGIASTITLTPFISLMAAVISSSGYLLATRKDQVVSHHLREQGDEWTQDQFASAVNSLKNALRQNKHKIRR